jgi:hypothetical protein
VLARLEVLKDGVFGDLCVRRMTESRLIKG